jgi:hypothetical protein
MLSFKKSDMQNPWKFIFEIDPKLAPQKGICQRVKKTFAGILKKLLVSFITIFLK